MGRRKKAQLPPRDIHGPCTVQVHPWYGDDAVILPYERGKTFHADPLDVAREFLGQGKGVTLRPVFFGEDCTDLGCLVMVSQDGTFGQR